MVALREFVAAACMKFELFKYFVQIQRLEAEHRVRIEPDFNGVLSTSGLMRKRLVLEPGSLLYDAVEKVFKFMSKPSNKDKWIVCVSIQFVDYIECRNRLFCTPFAKKRAFLAPVRAFSSSAAGNVSQKNPNGYPKLWDFFFRARYFGDRGCPTSVRYWWLVA